MTTEQLQLKIHHLVSETDDPEILQSIYVLLKKLLAIEADDIVGYEADGTPVTEEELVASALESSRDIRDGNGIPFKEVKAKFGMK